jgi:hypothetical protein
MRKKCEARDDKGTNGRSKTMDAGVAKHTSGNRINLCPSPRELAHYEFTRTNCIRVHCGYEPSEPQEVLAQKQKGQMKVVNHGFVGALELKYCYLYSKSAGTGQGSGVTFALFLR